MAAPCKCCWGCCGPPSALWFLLAVFGEDSYEETTRATANMSHDGIFFYYNLNDQSLNLINELELVYCLFSSFFVRLLRPYLENTLRCSMAKAQSANNIWNQVTANLHAI